jgi:hypothetical protein
MYRCPFTETDYPRTAQEVFDAVSSHLLCQREISVDNRLCAYRGVKNKACAIGCLIPDSIYRKEFEGGKITSLFATSTVLSHMYEGHSALLWALQGVHDYVNPSCWYDQLADVARHYGLVYSREPCNK